MPEPSIAPLKTEKIVVDAVHGYIQTTQVEYQILQLPAFNRLHYLRQMSLGHLVFPCASTTRFQHSLGTMHVASKMIQQMLGSLEPQWLDDLFPAANRDSGRKEVIQLVRLAALLHDIGHGPFSHASENIMLSAMNEADLTKACRLFATHDKNKIPAHEYSSYQTIMGAEIAEVLTKHGISSEHVASLLVKGGAQRPQICSEAGLEILRAVVSGQLDADRMDYLLRDSYMTGAPYGNVDIDRIIMYLMIRRRKPNDFRLVVDERALPSVEDMLDARFKMYKWVYGHHMVEALNQLIAAAMAALIKDVKNINLADFSWRNLTASHMTDNLIMYALHEGLNKSDKKDVMSTFAGILDRRYLPISILKWHPMDYDRFQRKIISKSKTEEKNDVLLRRIVASFKRLMKDRTLTIHVDRKDLNVSLFPSIQIRSPYEPIGKDQTQREAVYIYSGKDGNFSELTKASPYLNAVNEEWAHFPSYHLAYVIPGMLKIHAYKRREAVLRSVVGRISRQL